MRTGWEIIVAGRNFDPTEFFKTSRIQPCRLWDKPVLERRNTETSEATHTESTLQKVAEFSDWHDGIYPLDMATEAFDYLLTYQEEFKSLCRLPGIEERCLNFVDTVEGHGGLFMLKSSWITALAALNFSLDISVLPADVHPE